jgi:hypothetical protein
MYKSTNEDMKQQTKQPTYTIICNIQILFKVKLFYTNQAKKDMTQQTKYHTCSIICNRKQTSHTKQKRHKKTTLDSSKDKSQDKNESYFEPFLSGISLSCRRAELSPVFFPFTPLSTHFIFSENSHTNPRSLDAEYSYNRTMEPKIAAQTAKRIHSL